MLTISCCAALASGLGFLSVSAYATTSDALRSAAQGRARLCPAPSCSIIGLSSAMAAAVRLVASFL